MTAKREIFVSVDVETAGPIPGEYSLLSIGACVVDDSSQTFTCELKPINGKADPKALEVTGLSLEALSETGLKPADAMAAFGAWLETLGGPEDNLVFVGLNAPFDWSFVNYYFHRYLGRNPFGFTALDIKAFYMGSEGSTWADTRSSQMAKTLNPSQIGDHHALQDALYQAELFRLVRQRAMARR
jgi:DNA polymerase III epsilon subunit-like protein